MASNRSGGSFFERLARRCAQHPWYVIITWVMLLAIGAMLFGTVFSRNMTTVTEFTTDTDSKKADDLFKQRFPQAAYKVENAVITSENHTADDPEFWVYVDGLYARLQPLMEEGVVKSVQYYDPALRTGLPLMPGLLQQMLDALNLMMKEEPTIEELTEAAASLQASAAHLSEVVDGLTENLTASGAEARDGMTEAVDGAEDLAGSLLLANALQMLHDALEPIVAGDEIGDAVLRSTVQQLRDTSPSLRTAAADLEGAGAGTPARATLISGLRDAANGLEEVAGLYWLRDGITKTNNALGPIVDNQTVTTEVLQSTVLMLRTAALDLRAAAAALEATGPGTAEVRTTLIAGLRDAANGLEEVAGLYWLRDGLTKTYNALKPIVDGQEMTAPTLEATSQLLHDSAPALYAAADELESTGPGTSARAELVSGLRQTADGLEELGGIYSGIYWLRTGLTETYDALTPIVDNQTITSSATAATVQSLRNTAQQLRDTADDLEANAPATPARDELVAGLREAAYGLEEIAGLYWLREGLTMTYNALIPVVENQTITTEECRDTAEMLNDRAVDLRTTADILEDTGPGTSARAELISGLRQAANGLEEVAGVYWLRDGLTKSYNALVPMVAGDNLTDEIRDSTTTLLWDSAPEMRAAADLLLTNGPGTSDVFLVGSDGTILHYDGAAVSPMTSGTTNALRSIWGISPDDIFAVGAGGTTIHFNGDTWANMTSGTPNDLNAVWGTSSSDVFAVGEGGAIRHFNGSTWSLMTSGTTNDILGIWGGSSDNVFAVGVGGTILHYNGSAWSPMTSGTTSDLNVVWGNAGSDVFAVGNSGVILCYNGSSWGPLSSGTTNHLLDVWGSSSDNVFVVGNSGAIVHYDGASCDNMTSGTTNDLRGVWGNASFDIYAAGDSGVIRHYNGTAWSNVASGASSALCGVWGSSARTDLISGIRQSADGLEELAGVYELKSCAQKGLGFANMMTPDPLPTAEQVDPAVDEMPVTIARLRDAVARLEATGPGTAARPELIDGLDEAADELEANLSNAEMLRGLVDGRPVTDLLLYIALLAAQPTIEAQAATAQAGLDEIQQQCADNIGLVEDGLAQLQQESSDNIGSVVDGLAQIQQQCSDNLGLVEDGLAQLGEQFGQVEAGLAQIQQQCSDNMGTVEAGLAQITGQCTDQIGTVEGGLTQMRLVALSQLSTAAAGIEEARSGNEQAAGLVSTDRHTTLFAISMSEDADEAAKHIMDLRRVVLTGKGIGLGEGSFEDGFRVRMVGNSNVSRDMQDVALSDLKKSLSVAVPIALIVLLIVFGTLAAAMLPLVLSIISIIVALGIAAVVGIWMPLTFAIQNIVFMLGLALGIDHALFLAYRYREERRKGRDKIDAIARSGATAGHAIFYAGFIVVIALFGILMIPCNMHQSLALGAIVVVAAITPASITLLPAVLSLLGNRFDWGRLPWQKRISDIEQPTTAEERGFWHWITRPAMRFTIVSLLLCIGLIVVCILPMGHMRLGYSYVDTLPPTCVSRSGYDAMIEAEYPAFLVAPLDIAIKGYDRPGVKAETEALIQRLDADGGFVTAIPLEVNDDGDVAWKRVFLNMDPFTHGASDKVRQLRNELIGDSFTDAGGEALVTGYGAFNNDFVAVTQDYTTPVLIFVLGLSLLLMLVAFRSILFAVVCTIFNLLSVYAAYGLVVYVFQDGHGLGLYKQIQGIDAYVPIFLLCGLFGISMDYFVFVLSRNRERYDQTPNMSEAIMFAFRRSGWVVLGAAAVMLVVFFAFSISQIVIVAELGFGLCVSLLIDATLITLVISPATMKLLGKWFWWWPRWLNWVPDLRAKPASEEAEPEGIVQPPDTPAPTETNWPSA